MLEGFRPGVMDRLGLGCERLREANPKLVLVSVSGFAADDSSAARAGHDITYLTRSGLLSLMGEMPPVQVGAYNLYAAADGRRVALGALEAKFWRRFCEAVGRPELTDVRIPTVC